MAEEIEKRGRKRRLTAFERALKSAPWTPESGTSAVPAFAYVDGRELALSDAGEYRALQALRNAVSQGITLPPVPTPETSLLSVPTYEEEARRRQRLRLSSIDQDDEIRAFIVSRLGRQTQAAIRLALIEHFGAARAPTKSALSRFVTDRWSHRLRPETGND